MKLIHILLLSAAYLVAAPIFANEAPYQISDLGSHFEFTKEELNALIEGIETSLDEAYQPSGDTVTYYNYGVSTCDGWLTISFGPKKSPPSDKPSYYRLVYKDGYSTDSYRHDSDGIQLSSKVFYDQSNIPRLSLSYAKDGSITYYNYLTYDHLGFIKRVVTLDYAMSPVYVRCFTHTGIYDGGLSVRYSMRAGGIQITKMLYEDGVIYRIEDGEKIKANTGKRIRWIAGLHKKGIRPIYPLPDGFDYSHIVFK